MKQTRLVITEKFTSEEECRQELLQRYIDQFLRIVLSEFNA